MPDKHGFDHLNGTVRCIWCYLKEPVWKSSEADRKRHSKKHAADRAAQEAKTLEERQKIEAGEFIC